MKKRWPYLIIVIVVIVIAGIFIWPRLRGILPAVAPPSDDITRLIDEANENSDSGGVNMDLPPGENKTGFPLQLPDGFRIEIFARGLTGARVMAIDINGNMWVSQTSEGAVSLLTVTDGRVTNQTQVLRGLNRPHGLLFDYRAGNELMLYIAQADSISRLPVYTSAGLEPIAELPAVGRHFTRTLHWHPDGRLLVSIGSTCDVCYEKNPEHGAVMVMDRDGDNREIFASGLRNAVFLATNPVSGEVWVTEMGRDRLGDDLPPDEINILRAGGDYGWPLCYGANIHDTDFDKNIYVRDPCADKTPAHIDLPAHVAPLGLAFIPEDATGWPQDYWNDLLVAYHGSWNSSEPVGYKIARIELDNQGNAVGAEDFISGWLTPSGGALGRPVGLLALPGGVLYIADDKAGVIYRLTKIN